MGSLLNRLHRTLDERIFHDHLDLHLGQKVDYVLGPPIEFGVAFLPSEALGLGDGDALDPDFMKSFLHLVELEGLDDRLDLFHRLLVSLSQGTDLGAFRA